MGVSNLNSFRQSSVDTLFNNLYISLDLNPKNEIRKQAWDLQNDLISWIITPLLQNYSKFFESATCEISTPSIQFGRSDKQILCSSQDEKSFLGLIGSSSDPDLPPEFFTFSIANQTVTDQVFCRFTRKTNPARFFCQGRERLEGYSVDCLSKKGCQETLDSQKARCDIPPSA